MKDPMDRPTERGEETGLCPNCGYPEVVARRSRGEDRGVVFRMRKT
jgi:hypothetical protein